MRTDYPPQATELQSSEDRDTRAQTDKQEAEGPEEWEASGEEDESGLEGTDNGGATLSLDAAAQEQLAQKREAWTRELLDREPMIDMGVYTKNRCFRMYLCGKFGNDEPARWKLL